MGISQILVSELWENSRILVSELWENHEFWCRNYGNFTNFGVGTMATSRICVGTMGKSKKLTVGTMDTSRIFTSVGTMDTSVGTMTATQVNMVGLDHPTSGSWAQQAGNALMKHAQQIRLFLSYLLPTATQRS